MGRVTSRFAQGVAGRRARTSYAGLVAGWLVIAASFLPVSPAAAAQFPCTEQGIRDAIALGGGAHTFACVGPTTVVTAAQIDIDNDVILDGQGDLTIDGNGSHRVFLVADVSAGLRNLTVSGGIGGGIVNTGTLEIQNSTISGNTAVTGGGIFNGFFKTLTLIDSVVSGNVSTGTGTTGGGGIYNSGGGSLTLIRSIVSGNSAERRGGGIHNFSGGTVVASDSVISDNELLTASKLFDDGGGGIYHGSGALTLTNSTVARNSAGTSAGGGIRSFAGAITVTRSTISENGGTIFGSAWFGGGIANNGATVNLTNTTLSGNMAFQGGGDAIFNGSGALALAHCTVADNGASGGGQITGAIRFASGSVTLSNTLVANPLTVNCTGLDVTTNGGNVESPDDTCGFTDPSDQVNVTAGALGLGVLADNDGPTLTHDLSSGSVAIDTIAVVDCVDAQGMPLLTDQRGAARPQGSACDAGAVEVPEPSSITAGLVGIGALAALARRRRRSRGGAPDFAR